MKSGAMVDRDGKCREKVDDEREKSPFNNRQIQSDKAFDLR